jgi:hypothetical protein
MTDEINCSRSSRRRVVSLHGVLAIVTLLGAYVTALHFLDYSIGVILASLAGGAFALGVAGTAMLIGALLGPREGNGEQSTYVAAVRATVAAILFLLGTICGFYVLFFGTFWLTWLMVCACLYFSGWNLEDPAAQVVTDCIAVGTATAWAALILCRLRKWKLRTYLVAGSLGALLGVASGGAIYAVSLVNMILPS